MNEALKMVAATVRRLDSLGDSLDYHSALFDPHATGKAIRQFQHMSELLWFQEAERPLIGAPSA